MHVLEDNEPGISETEPQPSTSRSLSSLKDDSDENNQESRVESKYLVNMILIIMHTQLIIADL